MPSHAEARLPRCRRCGERRFLLLSYVIPIAERRALRRADLARRPLVKCIGCGNRYRSLSNLPD